MTDKPGTKQARSARGQGALKPNSRQNRNRDSGDGSSSAQYEAQPGAGTTRVPSLPPPAPQNVSGSTQLEPSRSGLNQLNALRDKLKLVPELDALKLDDRELIPALELLSKIEEQGERNALVPKGLSGADTLGLRVTENAHAMSLRGQGTRDERKNQLKQSLGLDGHDMEVELDDSWEDETGLVRSRARKFKHKGQRHDPSVLPPGHGPLKPPLPLLYDIHGMPAKPTPAAGMSRADFEKFQMEYLAQTKCDATGQYRLGIAEGLALGSMEDPDWSPKKPYPPRVAGFIYGVLEDKTNSFFELAPGAVLNAQRALRVQGAVVRGDYKFLRVTNLGDFRPFPKSHLNISWAEILGQHCSSFFEPLDMLKLKEIKAAEAAEDGQDPLQDGGIGGGFNCTFSEEEGSFSETAPGFEISFLRNMVGAGGGSMEEETEYCCNLIRSRFEQFVLYLERPGEERECCMCKGPGADCVFLTIGDYDISGIEWEDPYCFCMGCRKCLTHHMVRCDLTDDIKRQRCRNCREHYGGFQIHNAATKKLMLMQAATQVMLFFGPRREGEAEETFEENMMRRACIQTVIEAGFKRALDIELGSNRTVELRGVDQDHLVSKCWTCWGTPFNDTTSTGYESASIQGRLLLRMCEAEAQLDNYETAAAYAERSADLLSTLDRGRIGTKSQAGQHRHPARQLIIPARQIAKRMGKQADAKRLNRVKLLGAESGEGEEGGGEKHSKPKNTKNHKKKNKKGKKKK
mmetsp:Transcript_39380/g.53451  ORF Transcript_39380/g.53451 Transcript_39380/m.53451 type:complete len:745 (-) Transcript_39380:113-2347(-)